MTIDENNTVASAQGSMISSALLEETTGTDSSTIATKNNGWQCAAGANCDKESQGQVLSR
jgi:hypothetical protein